MTKTHYYDLGYAFRNSKIWKRLYEEELFAVKLPINGNPIGYCCVMIFFLSKGPCNTLHMPQFSAKRDAQIFTVFIPISNKIRFCEKITKIESHGKLQEQWHLGMLVS